MTRPLNPCFWLAALVASGCAYVPRVVRLEAPPPAPGKIAEGVCIKVERVEDARADQTTIGVSRNGFYWPTASARTPDDAGAWVAAYLRAALGPGTGDSCELKLRGEIRHLFVEEWFNLDGRLVVSVRLERQGQVVFSGDFEGAHSQLSQLGSSSEFEETLRQTLSAWGQNALPAIIAAAQNARPPPAL